MDSTGSAAVAASAIVADKFEPPLVVAWTMPTVSWRPDPQNLAQEIGGVSIAILCPYCRAQHYHGFTPGNPQCDGHRVAHCGADAGYFIRLASPDDSEWSKHAHDPRVRLTRPRKTRKGAA